MSLKTSPSPSKVNFLVAAAGFLRTLLADAIMATTAQYDVSIRTQAHCLTFKVSGPVFAVQ